MQKNKLLTHQQNPFLQTHPSSSTIHHERRHNQDLHAYLTSSSPYETILDLPEDQKKQTAMAEIEKKLRRMISNRESARRSRMRKKKQIEELHRHVDRLVISNRQLSEKLMYVLDWNQKILHENSELKEKVLTHQRLVTEFLSSNLCITNALTTEDSTVEQQITLLKKA